MKKSFLWIAALLVMAVSAFAQPPGSPLEIHHLTGNLYVYTTYKVLGGQSFPSNSMYLVTPAGVVMFDTPWDSSQFQPLLDSIEHRHHQPVVMCISTHFHDDRTAGLDFLRSRGVKTYSSRRTDSLSRLHRNGRAEFLFEGDTTFTVGGETFQAYYPGPGHAPDNIVIWFPQEKALYGGCLVKSTENSSLGNLEDANLEEWPKSIRKLQQRFPKCNYVIPGHFGWASNEGLEHTLELLKKNKR